MVDQRSVIFDLVHDFSATLESMPMEHPRRRLLKLLDEAVRRDSTSFPEFTRLRVASQSQATCWSEVDVVRGGWRSLQLIAHFALDDKRWQLRVVGGETPED